MATTIFLIALLLAPVFSIASIAYAQESGMRGTTSKGTLDILVEPTWSDGGNASFKVNFLNPGTDTLHEHQDYDFRIVKNDQVVFSAARQTGQALIHNVPGTLKVPYTFQEEGDYVIQVHLAGTGITPIIPTDEDVKFPIKVTPEFPVGAIGITAAVIAGSLVFAHRFRR